METNETLSEIHSVLDEMESREDPETKQIWESFKDSIMSSSPVNLEGNIDSKLPDFAQSEKEWQNALKKNSRRLSKRVKKLLNMIKYIEYDDRSDHKLLKNLLDEIFKLTKIIQKQGVHPDLLSQKLFNISKVSRLNESSILSDQSKMIPTILECDVNANGGSLGSFLAKADPRQRN